MNAMNAHRNMGSTTSAQGKSMEKLSSGLRINRAGDDAAGLAISEKMRSQIRGLNQASRNAQDGISMIQTAEGALSETHAIGQRMRELAVQSANGTYTDEDRELINQEFNQLKSEIDRIANDTEFNGSKVINGNLSSKEIVAGTVAKSTTGTGITTGMTSVADTDLEFGDEAHLLGEGNFTFNIDVDANGVIKIDLYDNSSFNDNKEYVMESITIDDVTTDIGQTGKSVGATIGGVDFVLNLENLEKSKQINFTIENTAQTKDSGSGVELQVGANKDQMIGLSMENMGSRELGLGGVSVSTAEDSKDAIGRLDKAVSRISAQRADLGAAQNRLEHTIASTDNTAENLQAAESRIRDVDMAKEMMNLTKLNVLQQASQSMLAQANQEIGRAHV